jgi:hypothetical protein
VVRWEEKNTAVLAPAHEDV